MALGATVFVLMALFAAPLFEKTLISTNINVSQGEPLQLEAIQLRRQLIGGLRIDVKASISTNQWVTYEIQLRDQQGKLLGSAIKQAWSESGTWYEDGESGSWQESDLLGGLDVRAQQNEEITLAIAVLEYGDTSGRDIDRPVGFKLTVKNCVVDTRYLWAGLLGSFCLSIVALIATLITGKKAIAKTISDSDPSGRATVGGSNCLVRVKVKVQADQTSPRQLEVRLFINNAYGEQIYARSLPLPVSYKREDGKITGATGNLEIFFLLEPRSSYGFRVEVMPDAPVDRTTLTVLDGSRTLQGISLVKISPSPLTVSGYP